MKKSRLSVCVVSALEPRAVEYAEEASKLPFQLYSDWLRNFLPSESIYYAGFYKGLERNFRTVCFSITIERLFWDYGILIQFLMLKNTVNNFAGTHFSLKVYLLVNYWGFEYQYASLLHAFDVKAEAADCLLVFSFILLF